MIDHLHVQHFKGFQELRINNLARVNLITGRNNTGKTSVLEALMMLGFPYNPNPVLKTRRDLPLSEKAGSGYVLDRLLSLFYNRNHLQNIHINGISFQLTGITDNDLKQLYRGQDVDLVRLASLDHEPKEIEAIRFGMAYASGIDDDYIIKQWSKIALTSREEKVEQILRLIEPNFIKASILNKVGGQQLFIQLKDKEHPYPIERLGEGINRLVSLALALFNAEGGFLLIDELENGLHYTIQPKIWEYLFRFAQELNVQIFATTHSRDCIEAFAEIAAKEDNKGESRVIRLFKQKDGQIGEVEFDEEEVQVAVENQIELR